MFKRPEDGEYGYIQGRCQRSVIDLTISGNDELVPQEGKDETYDTIMEEISGLEEELEEQLKKLQKKVK